MATKASASHAALSDVEASLNAPSAAERKKGEAAVTHLIDKFAPAHRRLVNAARKAVRKRLPTALEIVYEYRAWFVISYSPSARGYQGVLALRGDVDGIRLYFTSGKDLSDPDKLLRGAAQARWIDLEAPATLQRPDVSRLIDQAIARNKVAFAPTGKGAVVMRASSKQRSKSRSKTKTKTKTKT